MAKQLPHHLGGQSPVSDSPRTATVTGAGMIAETSFTGSSHQEQLLFLPAGASEDPRSRSGSRLSGQSVETIEKVSEDEGGAPSEQRGVTVDSVGVSGGRGVFGGGTVQGGGSGELQSGRRSACLL